MKNTMPALGLLLLLSAFPATAQEPKLFSVSDVVAGSQGLQTRYAYATGKWSDSNKDVGIESTQIHCYNLFGFCEVASAYSINGQASVKLYSFDILRWDDNEMIAVDSSPNCIMNTLRFDFAAKRVSLGSASRSGRGEKCVREGSAAAATAFLIGQEDEDKRIDVGAEAKKK